MMRNHTLKRIVPLAAAALLLGGCSEVRVNDDARDGKATITADAGLTATRVDVGGWTGTTFPLTWSEGDAIGVVELSESMEGDAIPRFALKSGAGETKATFEGEAKRSEAEYYAVYPCDALLRSDVPSAQLTLAFPTVQTPAESSIADPQSVVMVSEPAKLRDGRLSLRFAHAAAYGKLKLKNLKTDSYIRRITFSTQEVDIAGNYVYCYNNRGISSAAGDATASRNIVIDGSNLRIGADGTCEVLFSLIPSSLDDFKVEVEFGNGDVMIRNCFADGDPLVFNAGTATFFSVDMTKSEGVIDDIFEIEPQFIEVDKRGEEFKVTITTNLQYHIASTPDWIEELSTTQIGTMQIEHVFYAEPNRGEGERTDVIVFCDEKDVCRPAIISQPTEKTEGPEWADKQFYHRSLYMRFTATWCGNCPNMGKIVTEAQSRNYDKLEAVALHGAGSSLYFSASATIENQYKIGSTYPSGIVDGRIRIHNGEVAYTAGLVTGAMQETEKYYPTATGINFSSSMTGQTLRVDVTAYVQKADSYKITVLLLEDGIKASQSDYGQASNVSSNYIHDNVARMALTNVLGDSFTTTTDNTEQKFSYTATVPATYNRDNLRLLVYIQRAFGSQAKIQSADYGSYYVDNCLSAKVGTSITADTVEDMRSGGNESIKPGDDIIM